MSSFPCRCVNANFIINHVIMKFLSMFGPISWVLQRTQACKSARLQFPSQGTSYILNKKYFSIMTSQLQVKLTWGLVCGTMVASKTWPFPLPEPFVHSVSSQHMFEVLCIITSKVEEASQFNFWSQVVQNHRDSVYSNDKLTCHRLRVMSSQGPFTAEFQDRQLALQLLVGSKCYHCQFTCLWMKPVRTQIYTGISH